MMTDITLANRAAEAQVILGMAWEEYNAANKRAQRSKGAKRRKALALYREKLRIYKKCRDRYWRLKIEVAQRVDIRTDDPKKVNLFFTESQVKVSLCDNNGRLLRYNLLNLNDLKEAL